MSPFKRCPKFLGELLRAKGIITIQQLAEILDLQENFYKDKLLGEIALKLGYLKKEKLDFFLALQKGYPYVEILNYKINLELINLLSKEFCKKNKVLPLEKNENLLTIAMSNPLNCEILEKIQKKTQLIAKPLLVWPSHLEKVLERL